MLAQTMVLMAMVLVLALAGASEVAGYARARAASDAKAQIAPAVEQAVAAYQRYVAQTIAAQVGAPAGALAAAPAAIPALNAGTPWLEQRLAPYQPDPAAGFSVATDVVPTAQTIPVCGSATNGGPDVEQNGQCSPFVQESRLSLAVATTVGPTDPSGNVIPLASGRLTVTLRLFGQPPYSAIVGAQDAVTAADPHEGDLGGSGDTTIHVLYACQPGTGSCANSAPPSADRPLTLPWTNGNGAP